MSILNKLGINSSAIYIFLIFLVTFVILRFLVFEPFYRAFLAREESTKGNNNAAKEFENKSKLVHAQFEEQAKKINSQIKNIFDQKNKLALIESESLLTESKKQADEILEKGREQITREFTKAQTELQKEVEPVAMAITSKLLS